MYMYIHYNMKKMNKIKTCMQVMNTIISKRTES